MVAAMWHFHSCVLAGKRGASRPIAGPAGPVMVV